MASLVWFFELLASARRSPTLEDSCPFNGTQLNSLKSHPKPESWTEEEHKDVADEVEITFFHSPHQTFWCYFKFLSWWSLWFTALGRRKKKKERESEVNNVEVILCNTSCNRSIWLHKLPYFSRSEC